MISAIRTSEIGNLLFFSLSTPAFRGLPFSSPILYNHNRTRTGRKKIWRILFGKNAASGIDWRFRASDVVRFIAENRETSPFAMGIADNIGYFTPEEGSLRGRENAPFSGCSAGLTALGIDSVGNVRGCESMYDERFIEGNLRSRSLREIWEDPDSFAYNRQFTPEKLTGACAGCEKGPYCAGGCRSFNYFVHGKLYEAPRCARLGG